MAHSRRLIGAWVWANYGTRRRPAVTLTLPLICHPAVSEIAVVGRPHDDWGEEVVAFIVPRSGTTVSPQELDRFCVEHMSRFKRPKDYIFAESLPKNNYGKVLKTELRNKLGGRKLFT